MEVLYLMEDKTHKLNSISCQDPGRKSLDKNLLKWILSRENHLRKIWKWWTIGLQN